MSHDFIPPLADPADPPPSGAGAHRRPGGNSPRLRHPFSAWPVLGLMAALLWVAVLQGATGLVVWILGAAVLLLLTALYSLGFRRRSWAGLDTLEQRRFALSVSGVVLVVGLVAGVMSAPQPALRQNNDAGTAAAPPPAPSQPQLPEAAPPVAQDTRVDVQGLEVPAAAVEAGAAPRSVPAPEQVPAAASPCGADGETRVQQQVEYRCTPNTAGELIWMEKKAAELLVQERAAALEAARAEAARVQAQQAQEAAQREAAQNAATTPPPGSPPEVPPPSPDPTSPPEPTGPPGPTTPPDPTTPPEPPGPGTPTPGPGTPAPPAPTPPSPPNPDPTAPGLNPANVNPPNPTQPPSSGRSQNLAPVPDSQPTQVPVSGTLQSP